MKRLIVLVSILEMLATSAIAGTIANIEIRAGGWGPGGFTKNGLTWTNDTPTNWAVGLTAPTWGSSLLNQGGALTVPDGQYYLFMDGRDKFQGGTFNALQISIDSRVGVFALSRPGAYTAPGYSLVSGGGFSADAITPPNTQDLVGEVQSYAPNKAPDWVVGIDTSAPEPAAWTLTLLGGIGLFLVQVIRHQWRQSPPDIEY